MVSDECINPAINDCSDGTGYELSITSAAELPVTADGTACYVPYVPVAEVPVTDVSDSDS